MLRAHQRACVQDRAGTHLDLVCLLAQREAGDAGDGVAAGEGGGTDGGKGAWLVGWEVVGSKVAAGSAARLTLRCPGPFQVEAVPLVCAGTHEMQSVLTAEASVSSPRPAGTGGSLYALRRPCTGGSSGCTLTGCAKAAKSMPAKSSAGCTAAAMHLPPPAHLAGGAGHQAAGADARVEPELEAVVEAGLRSAGAGGGKCV